VSNCTTPDTLGQEEKNWKRGQKGKKIWKTAVSAKVSGALKHQQREVNQRVAGSSKGGSGESGRRQNGKRSYERRRPAGRKLRKESYLRKGGLGKDAREMRGRGNS